MPEFTREKRFKTRSVAGTLQIAATVAEMLPAPRVVLLRGELGAGKTTLVKGWAEALGLADAADVTSPTFTLVHEYAARTDKPGGVHLFHLDVYRLEREEELAALGIEEMAGEPGALVLIEWGERFASLAALATAEVAIEALESDERAFHIRWR